MDLTELRAEIDRLDDKIVDLYTKRLALCDEIARQKKDAAAPIRDEARENAVCERLCSGKNPADARDIAALYRALFAISRARQENAVKEV